MQNSPLWILIAEEQGATISASNGGISEIIARFGAWNENSRMGMKTDDLDEGASSDATQAFANKLVGALREGADARAYDSVVIVASGHLLKELQASMDAVVSQRLVGGIVEMSASPV